ncbi:MAG: class I SAM-dependent methyltransferase [Pseudomonadales bacterium]
MKDLPLDPALPIEKRCRVCGSEYVAYLRHVPMLQMPLLTPMYICLGCELMMHPQIYRESDEKLQKDAEWHVSMEERNRGWARQFWDGVQAEFPKIRSVLEIGCATGSFLSVAQERGLTTRGHDNNPHVRAAARERHGIDVDMSLWSNATCVEKYDLIVAIMVLEHLVQPARLMGEIGAYCRRMGSAAYVSVPFNAERHHWPDYWVEKPEAGNPLFLCDVHLNHFSRKSFELMASSAGARAIRRFDYGWMGYWLEF